MAVIGGGGGDQKHKLAAGGDHSSQQLEAANGPFEVETFDWPSSSPFSSSTQQMFGNIADHQQQHRRRGSSKRFAVPSFVKKKKIDWGSLWDKSKERIRNPLNMALFIWIVAVGVSAHDKTDKAS